MRQDERGSSCRTRGHAAGSAPAGRDVCGGGILCGRTVDFIQCCGKISPSGLRVWVRRHEIRRAVGLGLRCVDAGMATRWAHTGHLRVDQAVAALVAALAAALTADV